MEKFLQFNPQLLIKSSEPINYKTLIKLYQESLFIFKNPNWFKFNRKEITNLFLFTFRGKAKTKKRKTLKHWKLSKIEIKNGNLNKHAFPVYFGCFVLFVSFVKAADLIVGLLFIKIFLWKFL